MDVYIRPSLIRHFCVSCCTLSLLVSLPILTFRRDPRSSPIPLTLYCWFERAPHSLTAYLFHARTRPPLENDNACNTTNLLPQLSHSVRRFKGTITYQRRRLSWNSSLDNYVMLRRWGIAVSHSPFSVALRKRLLSWPISSSLRHVNSSVYEKSCGSLPFC